MKKKNLLFSCIFGLLFTSCGQSSPILFVATSIYDSTLSFEENTIQIQPIQVKKAIESKETFFFFLGSDDCASCNQLKPLLKQYLQKESITLYYLNLSKDDYFVSFQNELVPLTDQNQEKIFENAYTPTFYFFQNGAMVKDKDGSDPHRHGWKDYPNLKAYLKKRIGKSKLTYKKDEAPIEKGIVFRDYGNSKLSQNILKYAQKGYYQSAIFSNLEEKNSLEIWENSGKTYIHLENKDWEDIQHYWEET